MKLKTLEVDGKTYAEVQDGKPVYTDDDGKEFAFDAPATKAAISKLNGEAMGHREAKEAAEKALRKFEGIDDPKAALDALKKVKSLGEKELFDAGKVDEIKAAAIKAIEDKYQPYVAKSEKLEAELRAEKIGGSFARSKFIADKIAVPFDFIESRFGSHFALEDGKVVAKGADGKPIYSKSNPGTPASFDEALEILVDAYPQKELILKGVGGSGSGKPGGGGAPNGSKQISRAEFDSMPQHTRAAKMKDGFKVVDA